MHGRHVSLILHMRIFGLLLLNVITALYIRAPSADVRAVPSTKAVTKPDALYDKVNFPQSALEEDLERKDINSLSGKLKGLDIPTEKKAQSNPKDQIKEAKVMKDVMTALKNVQDTLFELDKTTAQRHLILVFETSAEREKRLALIDNYVPVEVQLGITDKSKESVE